MKCGQGYIFTGMCDSVHMGGSASVHAGILHPPEQAPPQDQAPTPPAQSMLGDMVNARVVRILLECNLVKHCHGRKFYILL